MAASVCINCDRQGWYWFVPPPEGIDITDRDKSARARTYDEIIAHAKAAGYEVDNAGWKQKVLLWNWNSMSFDRWPGWAIEEGAPPWCRLEHVNSNTAWPDRPPGKRAGTIGSTDLARAWDDVAAVQFYSRDISYDGGFGVGNGEPYGSLWWFRTIAERDRFLAWVAEYAPDVRIVYRSFKEWPKKQPHAR